MTYFLWEKCINRVSSLQIFQIHESYKNINWIASLISCALEDDFSLFVEFHARDVRDVAAVIFDREFKC